MRLLNLQNSVVKELQQSKKNKTYQDNIVLPAKDFLKELINARKISTRSDCCSRSRYIHFFR